MRAKAHSRPQHAARAGSWATLFQRVRKRLKLSSRSARIVATVLSTTYPAVVTELLHRHLVSSTWQKTSRAERNQSVWGYVDRHSIDPGQSFQLMLSAAPGAKNVSGHVEIYRIGYEGQSDRRLVWRSDSIEVEAYTAVRAGRHSKLVDRTAAALGQNWPCSLEIEDTHSWTTGYYSIDFVDADTTRDSDTAFMVVTDPKRAGDVLVKLATATYQAYNRWGGHSLYDDDHDRLACRGHMVSFDRPTRSEFWEWEYFFVLWLERLARDEGFSVSYATNFDVTRDESFSLNYRLFVSVGHDEYWSKEEFDRVYDRIFRKGGNTLFLGANTAYWQVRYVDVNAYGNEWGRQLVSYKSLNDPIRTRHPHDQELHATARFRDAARRPETMLMGVAYQSSFKDRDQIEPRYGYRVEDTEFPALARTGYKKGDFVADIIGHEWDNRDPEVEYPTPGESSVDGACRLWQKGRSMIEAIPLEKVKVVFSADVVDLRGLRGRAEAVYFESPAGAKVFSSGTIRWTWGLGKEGYTQEQFKLFNRNLILHFLRN